MLIDFEGSNQPAVDDATLVDFDTGGGGEGEPPIANPPLTPMPRRLRLLRRRKLGW